jgi:hypothetical protein
MMDVDQSVAKQRHDEFPFRRRNDCRCRRGKYMQLGGRIQLAFPHSCQKQLFFGRKTWESRREDADGLDDTGIIERYGGDLDAAMRAMASGSAMSKTMEHILDALLENPGKRIRPALVLGTQAALGGRAEDALPLAAAVEWIHTASLIHDDIEDLDHFRRGEPTVWRRFGVPHAINAGDRILAGALAQIANAQWLEKSE